MNLDRMTIAVRRRTLPEIYDLALLVSRRHGGRLAALVVIGSFPWVVLDMWLLHGLPGQAWTWYWLLLLAAVQAPMATAPVTAFLGQAMFDERPSARAALRKAMRRLPALMTLGLWYGVLTVVPPALVLAPPHQVAVLVLEDLRGRAAWSRAAALRSAWSGEWVLHLLLAPALVAAVLWLSVGTAEACMGLFGSARVMPDPEELLPQLDPTISAIPAMVLFATLGWLAIVHFLAYLDLRTAREGWDIDLALRRAAQRLEPTHE